MPPDKARDAAVAIVDADGHGTVTHGLKNLRNYITEVKAGRFNPKPNIRVVGGPKAAAIIDADNAQGHVAAAFGMRKAIELAKEYSVGSAFVRSSNHYGHSGYWSSMAVRHNMVGFAITNASAGIAPFGGKVGLIGNNPPSWAIPTRVVDPSKELPASEYQPVFLDMALSVVAANRLDIFRRRGEPLPRRLGARQGWRADRRSDRAGQRRHDHGCRRLQGRGHGRRDVDDHVVPGRQPAGHRTASARTASASLARPATGSRRTTSASSRTWRRSRREARETRERLQASPPKAGVERVYAPGDMENAKAIEHQKNGIPLEQFTLDDLAWVAEHVGIKYDLT